MLRRRLGAAAGRALERLLTDEVDDPVTRFAVDVRSGPDATFAGPQVHLATEGCGQLDPLDVDAYLAAGGFAAMTRALNELDPPEMRSFP